MEKLKRITNIILWSFIAIGWILVNLLWFTISSYNNTYTYNGEIIVKHSWHDVVRVSMRITTAVISVAVICYAILKIVELIKQKKTIVKNIFKNIGILFLAFVTLISMYSVLYIRYNLREYSHGFYEFSGGNHTIIVEEYSNGLFSGGGRIYQIKDDKTANIIGGFQTDDGAFSSGDYGIEWFDDRVEITYKSFMDGGPEYSVIVCEFE